METFGGQSGFTDYVFSMISTLNHIESILNIISRTNKTFVKTNTLLLKLKKKAFI